jgi:Flp pilus assembly protein TadG
MGTEHRFMAHAARARTARDGRGVGLPGGRARRRQRGAALVEFAICLPVLAMLALGIVDLGRAYSLAEQARSAAREAAFYAASHPGQLRDVPNTACADPANATWRGANAGAGSFAFAFSPDLANRLTDCNPSPMPAGLQAGQPLRVTATTKLTLFTPLIGAITGNPVQVSATVCIDVAGPPSTVPCS